MRGSGWRTEIKIRRMLSNVPKTNAGALRLAPSCHRPEMGPATAAVFTPGRICARSRFEFQTPSVTSPAATSRPGREIEQSKFGTASVRAQLVASAIN
jgi:hypothetical protein